MEIKPNNIYLGDAYELIQSMEDKSVDLIITDPPYKMETGGTGHSEISLRFRKRYRELENHSLDVGIDMDILKEMERVCKYIYIYGVIRLCCLTLSLIIMKGMMLTWTLSLGEKQTQCHYQTTSS